VVMNLQTGKTLYEMPAMFNYVTGAWYPLVGAMVEGRLEIDTVYDPDDGSPRFVRLNDDQADVIEADVTMIDRLGDGWWLTAPSGLFIESLPGHLDLFNLNTQQKVAFLDMGTLPYAITGLEYLGGNQFRVRVVDLLFSHGSTPAHQAEYVVKVNGVS